MMRVLGGWIALTPELPAKLLFGRHVWDCAQHADLWGRRLPELRAPAQQSEPAGPAVVGLLDLIETAEAAGRTVERITAIYRVLKPHLATVYERHLAVANRVYEPPTRRILARAIAEERRHAAAGAIVLERLIAADRALAGRADAWAHRVMDALAAARGVTGDVETPLVTPPDTPPDQVEVAQDLVPAPPAFDPAAALGELAAPLAAHRGALERGDVEALRTALAPEAGPDVAGAYAGLPGPFARTEVIGCARIGRQRVVKLWLDSPRGRVVLQERWLPSAAGWHIVAVEVTPTEPES
jgi:hypothetical protein